MSQHKHQGIGDHNECRHRGGETSQFPWCYTGSTKQEKWEYCHIERCDSELKLSHESLVNDFYFYSFTHSRHAEHFVNLLQVNKKIDLEHTAAELLKNYYEKLVPIYGNGKCLHCPGQTGYIVPALPPMIGCHRLVCLGCSAGTLYRGRPGTMYPHCPGSKGTLYRGRPGTMRG